MGILGDQFKVLVGFWRLLDILISFRVSPETPKVESTHLVEGKVMLQGVQYNSYRSQMADPQTSRQQIDHQLIDQLLIYQWKLVKIDKLMMEL